MSEKGRERDIQGEDTRYYDRYTGPQKLDKAMHTLEGILKGISADGVITEQELGMLRQWLREHDEHAHRHPFNEITPLVDDILKDGIVDEDDAQDVLWLCERMSTSNEYFSAITSDIQRLQGMLGGIVADGQVSMDELTALEKWMDKHEHLKGCWPFDELDTLLLEVRKDGKIDADEHRMLMRFFAEFMELGDHCAVDVSLDEMVSASHGLCAVCPDLTFETKLFGFTGRSVRASRREFAKVVEELGGTFLPKVRNDMDYLIINGAGNPAWSFACYGRKVEQAYKCRKSGHAIVLVHENDFWDAVEDARS